MSIKVLLVWPGSLNEVLGWGDLGAIAEPLALEYLGAALKANGHSARILDLRLHPKALSQALEDYKPDLVGVSAFSMHVRRANQICDEVKLKSPTTATIVGGHHATFLPEDFFQPSVDFVVSGDGTKPIVAVANALEKETPHWAVGAVKGLHKRNREGCFKPDTDGANYVNRDSFKEIRFPDRSLTASDRSRYFIDWMSPVALLRTTVGCPYRCSFCSVWQVMEGQYFLRDIKPVVEELAEVAEENVFLVDDEAFINSGRMINLAQAIEDAGIRKNYFTYCRIDTLLRNHQAVRAWREIGLRRLFIGIDAISPKDLSAYNKKCDIAQIERGLAMARDIGIDVFAQFVVNTDYTPDDFKALVRFVEHHRIEYPSFTVLTPLPGTDLLPNFDLVTERQPNGRPNWDLFDLQNAVTATAMPKEEFRRRYRSLYRVFKGAYAQYREHRSLVNENFEKCTLDRPVSTAMRVVNPRAEYSV